MTKKLEIALLTGGNNSEREVALSSSKQVASILNREKYNVTIIDLQGREWLHTDDNGDKWAVDRNDFSITINGEKRVFEYALIIIHGTPGEDGKLQGYLDIMEVPYSSCSTTSSAITFDKAATKRMLAGSVINLAKEIFLTEGMEVDAEGVVSQLGLPLFIKPNRAGSSFGVSKVKESSQITDAVTHARTESQDVLIEEFIPGREMACGIMITKQAEYIFPITEIVPKKEFFDYEAKYTGASEEITPAPISEELQSQLNDMTREAYRLCGCSGLVRIDFMVTPQGVPYLIEINSIPGMSEASIVPQQVRAAGLSLTDVFDALIEDTYKK